MAQKYYAVRQGKVPGIYESWDACRAQVHGYSQAIYKSFPTREEAEKLNPLYYNSALVKYQCAE